MLNPHTNTVLVEEIKGEEAIGSFTFNVEDKVLKGKVLKVGKLNDYVSDVKEGDVIIYNKNGNLYTCVDNDRHLAIVDIMSVFAMEN